MAPVELQDDLAFLERNLALLNTRLGEAQDLAPRLRRLQQHVDAVTHHTEEWLTQIRAAATLFDFCLSDEALLAARSRVAQAEKSAANPPAAPGASDSGSTTTANTLAVVAKDAQHSQPTRRVQSVYRRPVTRMDMELYHVRRLMGGLSNERFRSDSRMESVLLALLRSGHHGAYLHDIVRTSGLSRMQCNMYLNALLKADLVSKRSKQGLLYTLKALPRFMLVGE
ncbi:hypothetical protein CDCA_CDCA14G3822 [Cyanidium caldarium]|uniref:B-block binding subunit of TFIIIC domain-containing protein n=1 Tax=Cyanidium caldarium TaxID=2771 RepID=A0AAV9IZN2_CYACA|nr:hypothetical protein CDCA_CDCA14G3822 [Cyanidium caldarium]